MMMIHTINLRSKVILFMVCISIFSIKQNVFVPNNNIVTLLLEPTTTTSATKLRKETNEESTIPSMKSKTIVAESSQSLSSPTLIMNREDDYNNNDQTTTAIATTTTTATATATATTIATISPADKILHSDDVSIQQLETSTNVIPVTNESNITVRDTLESTSTKNIVKESETKTNHDNNNIVSNIVSDDVTSDSMNIKDVETTSIDDNDKSVSTTNKEDLSVQQVLVPPIQNLHMALIGDSITRFQYIDLVYYLHTGKWLQNDDQPDMVNGKTFASWNEFFNISSYYLDGKEQCDCFRVRPRNSFENRYYVDPINDNYISYVTKFGKIAAQGHWNASDTFSNNTNLTTVLGQDYQPALWKYDWIGLIKDHIQHLSPRPQYIVLNAGLWSHDLDNIQYLQQIQDTMKAINVTSIYKTTTARQRDDVQFLLDTYQHEQNACQIFDLCMNTSWTANITGPEYYWDTTHFRASVNQQLNEQLFQILSNHTSSSLY